MLIAIPDVLNAQALGVVRERLAAAGDAWVDGRVTAGHQGAVVKHNLQLDEQSPIARELGALIVGVLERHPLFLSAALPSRIYPPLFNRYDGTTGMHFGRHVDGAVRLLPGTGDKIRTDLAATLFLSDPECYDGGELVIDGVYGTQSVKLPAGHMVLYPATSLHRVLPVTRGSRLASFLLAAEHGARGCAARAAVRSRHGDRPAHAGCARTFLTGRPDGLLPQPGSDVGGALSATAREASLDYSARPRARTAPRGLWLQIHLWLGLTLGIVGALLGVTGSLLVYDSAIDGWLNPGRYRLTGEVVALHYFDHAQRAEAAVGGGARRRAPTGSRCARRAIRARDP
jgi:PKHD-type hydroxylase